jgi:hypothetical protein
MKADTCLREEFNHINVIKQQIAMKGYLCESQLEQKQTSERMKLKIHRRGIPANKKKVMKN